MNPFLRQPAASQRTPLRAELPASKNVEPGVVTLRLYDPIDSWGEIWGVSAKEFVKVLDELPDDTTEIRLLINSPGGEVWEGLAILNSLRAHKARVVAVVEGIAASSASFIACGVDELQVMKNAEMFIHNAWGLVVGNSADMQKMSEELTHEDRNIASVYADKAGGTVDEWLAKMADETWFSAEEALEAGLADGVIEPAKGDSGGAAAAKNKFDLSVFAHGDRQNRAASAPKSPVPPSASGSTNTAQEADMSLSDALRERLGIADENADEDTILAALDEAIDQATAPKKDDEVPAPALAEITRLSAELAELRAKDAKREKDELFAAWLRDGKTAPAERAELEAAYDQAPAQITALVNARAKGSVAPVDVIGHGGDPSPSADDLIFAELFGAEKKVS